MPVQGTVKTIDPRCWRRLENCCLRPKKTVSKSIPVKRTSDHSVRWADEMADKKSTKCCISLKTMLYPNFSMVWYADIIIFSGFVAMCMYKNIAYEKYIL
jgi:hypothetical protein